MHRRTFLVTASGALSLAGCRKNEPVPPPEAPIEKKAVEPPPPFVAGSIGLYLPEFAMKERGVPEPKVLADYLLRLTAAAEHAISAAPEQPGVAGAFVVAIKPPARSKIWVVLGDAKREPALTALLKEPLEAIPAFPVLGLLAFWRDFEAWGGGPTYDKLHVWTPIPAAWKAELKEGDIVPDGAFPGAWPD